MLFLKLRDASNTAAEVLWGVWLFPLAVLIYKSRLLPRFLGVWLAIGGVAYFSYSMAGTLWPQYQITVFVISQPATFCEIALTLWLVIKGAEPRDLGARKSACWSGAKLTLTKGRLGVDASRSVPGDRRGPTVGQMRSVGG